MGWKRSPNGDEVGEHWEGFSMKEPKLNTAQSWGPRRRREKRGMAEVQEVGRGERYREKMNSRRVQMQKVR